MTVRVDLVARGSTGVSPAPLIGFRISEPVLEMMSSLGTGRRVAMLLSASCSPCLAIIDDFRHGDGSRAFSPDELVVLLAGDADDSVVADGVTALSQHAHVVTDPRATSLARGLGLSHTPSAVLLADGVVEGTAFLSRAADLDDLVRIREEPAVLEVAAVPGAIPAWEEGT